MTDESKKLIESVGVFLTNEVTDYRIQAEWVLKSDFDMVVEEFTKWNKVEDCLPEMNQTVIVKRNSGKIGICDFKNKVFVDTLIGLSVNVTEWKQI